MIAALIDFGFSGLGLARIEAMVEPGNPASVRTMERAGLTREGLLRSYTEITGARRDLLMFSLIPGDARGAQ